MPTWPIAVIIILMTSVFGVSVAVWCGELEWSQCEQLTHASVDQRAGIGARSDGATTTRLALIATVADDNENRTRKSGPSLAPLRSFAADRATSDSAALDASLADSHRLTISLTSMKGSNPGQPPIGLLTFSVAKSVIQWWESTANVDRLKAAANPFLTQVGVGTMPSPVSRDRLLANDLDPILSAPTPVPIGNAHGDRNPIPAAELAVSEVWPMPDSLLQQLEELEQALGFRSWQINFKRLLHELANTAAIEDPKVKIVLDDLSLLADQLWEESRSIAARAATDVDRATAAHLSRTSYDLHRQVSLWQWVHRFSTTDGPQLQPQTTEAQSIAFRRWNFDQVDPQWRDYLGLDLLEQCGPNARQSARTVLGRLHSVGLDSAQRAFVGRIVSPELERELRQTAATPLDLNQFLIDVESYHRQSNGFTQSRLNDHFQNCIWGGSPQDLTMAQILEDHYRNANVRIAISETLMNRILARPRSANEPVRDHILGANVSGRSQITNQLGIQLVPDERQWSLVLTTTGNVLSRTQAHRDGFVIHSVGTANVVGSKRLSVSYDGVTSQLPQVEAITDNQVIGLDSPFDDIPMLGWTARRIAQRKQQASAPVADQIVRSRIRSRVQERMEQAVTAALQKAKTELDRLIISRFVDWSLEPQPIEMSTTENDVVLRYRLAGFDQMAADTPRPSIDDQMAGSLQLHESAVNNGLARLDLADATFTMETLLQHLRAKLKTNFDVSDGSLHQVEVGFAPYDPIRVDFADDSILLTINLKRLQIDRGKNWRNVTVQTRYEVQFDGFYLTLRQSGGVRASGNHVRVRDEIAIGAIFDQLLSDEYRYSLLPQEYEADFLQSGIRLAHIALADGWLSVAYDKATQAPVESRQTIRLPPRMR